LHYAQGDPVTVREKQIDSPGLISSCLAHNIYYPPCGIFTLLSCHKLGYDIIEPALCPIINLNRLKSNLKSLEYSPVTAILKKVKPGYENGGYALI
jgi:hypothetical protein